MTLDEMLLQILETEELCEQKTLLARLAMRGHVVTQSTLSRHLKRLGVIKVRGRYSQPRQGRWARTGGGSPVEAVLLSPPNLVVIRTAPGHAHAVGFQLDADGFAHIVGSVAGDDTLLVAVSAPDKLESVRDAIARAYGGARD
jgi:transcriptional regulator of arginine metabolism